MRNTETISRILYKGCIYIDVLTSVYDTGISLDTLNSLKIVSKTV